MVEKAVGFKKVSRSNYCKNTKIIVYLKTYLEYSYPIKLLTNSRFDLNNTVSKVAIWMVIALIFFIFRQFDGTRGISRKYPIRNSWKKLDRPSSPSLTENS